MSKKTNFPGNYPYFATILERPGLYAHAGL